MFKFMVSAEDDIPKVECRNSFLCCLFVNGISVNNWELMEG